MTRRLVCAALVAMGASGCHGSSTVDETKLDKGAPREDPGPVRVELDGEATSFILAPGGDEIIYPGTTATRDGEGLELYALRAVRVSDGASRDLSLASMHRYDSYALTPDGTGLYYVAYDPSSSRTVLREAFTRTEFALGERVPQGLVVSSDSAHLLVTVTDPKHETREVLWVDRATGMAEPTPCSFATDAVFSPAGDEVACHGYTQDGGPGLVRYGLEDGSARELPGLPGCACRGACSSYLVARWTTEGIVAACRGVDGSVVLGDLSTGQVTATVPATSWGHGRGAFSPDGAAYAFTSGTCLTGSMIEDGQQVSLCSTVETQVRVLDLATGQPAVIAVSGEDAGTVAFSDDGRTLLYRFGKSVHARPSGLGALADGR